MPLDGKGTTSWLKEDEFNEIRWCNTLPDNLEEIAGKPGLTIQGIAYRAVDEKLNDWFKGKTENMHQYYFPKSAQPIEGTDNYCLRILRSKDGGATFENVVLGKTAKGYPCLPGGGMQVHIMVAILWGARNNSPYPPSLVLVVDHINNDSMNWGVENLQFMTHSSNARKGKRKGEDTDKQKSAERDGNTPTVRVNWTFAQRLTLYKAYKTIEVTEWRERERGRKTKKEVTAEIQEKIINYCKANFIGPDRNGRAIIEFLSKKRPETDDDEKTTLWHGGTWNHFSFFNNKQAKTDIGKQCIAYKEAIKKEKGDEFLKKFYEAFIDKGMPEMDRVMWWEEDDNTSS
ncbi:hypothetical protein TrRE_jg11976 [Triparma retinervis]|uniref:Uncharacterized protein n=1 Tax=Triparma retinervis TaxID=2557542 RepID=A0A9W6Z9I7_9STRA|nr:hypothetical protein TrRE_jg11976 [Triparma retinervis]